MLTWWVQLSLSDAAAVLCSVGAAITLLWMVWKD
jgi:hypothetical protein